MNASEVIRIGHAGRKVLFQLIQRSEHLMVDGERIGAGLGIDQQHRRIAAVLIGRAAVVGGTDLDAADVPDAGHVAPVVEFDDDVGEFLGRRQPAERFDVDLIGLAARDRRLVQNTGRDRKSR
jgi:hypothetical protein